MEGKRVNFWMDESQYEALRNMSERQFGKANISALLRTLAIKALEEAGAGK